MLRLWNPKVFSFVREVLPKRKHAEAREEDEKHRLQGRPHDKSVVRRVKSVNISRSD
jgi:hypothetical protein